MWVMCLAVSAADCGLPARARHAHPHKADAEVYDRSLLEFATDLTHELDARFGQPPKKTLLLVRAAAAAGLSLPAACRRQAR